MEKLLIRVAYILIACLLQSSSAQENFRVEVNAGPTINTTLSGMFINWNDGWVVGGGVAYPVTQSIEVAANGSYHIFTFNGKNLQIVKPAVYGWESRVDGKATDIYETSIAVRFYSANRILNPYFSVRTGLYFINIGAVTTSTWNEQTPRNVSTTTNEGTGIFSTDAFASLGFGFNIPVQTDLWLKIEVNYSGTFNGGQHFIPILGTVQYQL